MTSRHDAWKTLAQHIPLSALDDDSPNAKCLNGTRTQLLSDIMQYLGEKRRSVVWLQGEPGMGKTAVALTVADTLRSEGRLAGCFFFPHEEPGRRGLNYVLPTIAYQLGIAVQTVQGSIADALNRDPGLLGKHRSFSHQVLPCFIEPMRQIRGAWDRSQMRVLIFDGVDGCCSPREHVKIIHFFKLLADTFRTTGMPDFHILFTSRSRVISDQCYYQTREVVDNFRVVDLKDHFAAADRDISMVVKSRLEDIRLRRPNPYPTPWPSAEDVEVITARAASNFRSAEIFVRFVDDPDPIKQLTSLVERCNADMFKTEVHPTHDEPI